MNLTYIKFFLGICISTLPLLSLANDRCNKNFIKKGPKTFFNSFFKKKLKQVCKLEKNLGLTCLHGASYGNAAATDT